MFKLVPGKKPDSVKIAEVPEDDIFTKEVLERIGKVFLDAIKKEISKSLALQGNLPTPPKQPEGIPTDPAFMKSFSYRVVGHDIEIVSTWPTAKQIVEGRKAYKMKWLTQEKGVKKVPVGKTAAGEVIIRSTPKSSEDAWVHPGFKKHNFIEKGLKRAEGDILKIVRDQIRRKILSRRYL